MPRNDVLAMLSQSPGWQQYKEIIEKKIQDAYDIIKSKQLVDQESVSRHNVSIGKIQCLILQKQNSITGRPSHLIQRQG